MTLNMEGIMLLLHNTTLHECNLLPHRGENTFYPDAVEQYLLFALYLTSTTKHLLGAVHSRSLGKVLCKHKFIPYGGKRNIYIFTNNVFAEFLDHQQ